MASEQKYALRPSAYHVRFDGKLLDPQTLTCQEMMAIMGKADGGGRPQHRHFYLVDAENHPNPNERPKVEEKPAEKGKLVKQGTETTTNPIIPAKNEGE